MQPAARPMRRRLPSDSAMRPRAQRCLAAVARARVAGSPGDDQTEKAGRQMFDTLSERLGGILDRLTRRGALTEADVDAALREVRRALLEADVALDVVRAFVHKV